MNCQPHWIRPVYKWLFSDQFCLLCDERTDTAMALCTACEFELPWLNECCQQCALPLPKTGLSCGFCLKQPPAFQRVHAPWFYGFPIDSLIVRFKHNSKWPYGRLLAELLGQSLLDHFNAGHEKPDVLLPVPCLLNACASAVITRQQCSLTGSVRQCQFPAANSG